MHIFLMALFLPLVLFCPTQEFVQQRKKVVKQSKTQLLEKILQYTADTINLLLEFDQSVAQGAQETAAAKKEIFNIAVDILNQEYGKSKSIQECANACDDVVQIKEQVQMLVLEEKDY